MDVSKKFSEKPKNIIFLPLFYFGVIVIAVIVLLGVELAAGIEALLGKIYQFFFHG